MLKNLKISPYSILCSNWEGCTKCDLHKFRKQVVFARGNLPADILFIGEGPGDSENILGAPFKGPAGKLLDSMIEDALRGLEPPRIAFFNLVGCIPKDDGNHKKGEPNANEIAACYPRLEKFLTICKPTMIICVGRLAEKAAKQHNWANTYKLGAIIHPAAILKSKEGKDGKGLTNRELEIQRTIVRLNDLFSTL